MSTIKLTPIAAIFLGCSIALTSINSSFAQSTDRDNPTPLTEKILSNPGTQNENTVYYYSLTAKPGKITITIDSDAGSVNDAFSTTVRLETLNGKNLVYANAVSSPGSPNRTVDSADFTSETPVLLLISSRGHHKIKIDGDWTQSGSASTPPVVANPSVGATPTKKPQISGAATTTTPPTTDSTTPAPEMITAVVRKKPEIDYSEEQTLSASCNSTGQVCDNSVIFNFRPSRNHSLIWLTAPSTHCSVINYFVEDAQNPKYASGTQLAPGKTSFVQVGLLAKGSTRQFRIRATGVKGGCNTGRLVSWSVKVRLGSGKL
jgi:hypothetical protein